MKKVIMAIGILSSMLAPTSGQDQLDIPLSNWMKVRDRAFDSTRWELHDVCFINPDTGFVVGGFWQAHGYGGAVYVTHDAGTSWSVVQGLEGCPVFCHFINDATGFIQSYGTLGPFGFTRQFNTKDGGCTWEEDSLHNFRGIFTLNNAVSWAIQGYFIDDCAQLYQTWDGGETWDLMFDPIEEECGLKSISFMDHHTAYGVGESGLMLRITSGEYPVIDTQLTTLPLEKVYFHNNRIGWIAGGYINNDGFSPIFFRTEDGAGEWKEVPGLEYLIHDFHFADSIHGWAVGEDYLERGVILETIDGGLNWEVVVDHLSARLNSFHFVEDYGWAVGDDGLILRYEQEITSPDPIPVEAEMDQLKNYPNPISSRTVIGFNIAATGGVVLDIHDLSGRKIVTLVNEYKPAGNYEVEWNATGMEPGIYLCTLTTPRGRKIMKMLKVS